jgi:hypothetical protein
MGIFSKKEDKKYIQEFDAALSKINDLAARFRQKHFESLACFDDNFKKEKKESDFEKERIIFESHLELMQELKTQTDLLINEAVKIVRNFTDLTEKDRAELRKILVRKEEE